MQLDDWFEYARRDALRRGLPDLEPLLDMLFRATRKLRAADWARTGELDAAGRDVTAGDDAGARAGNVDPAPARRGAGR